MSRVPTAREATTSPEVMNTEHYLRYHKSLPERIRHWLFNRGISEETIVRHHIGWNGRAITIPVFDRSGRFAFFKYRRDPDATGDGPKYWFDRGSSPELYGWEHLREGRSPLVIVEGELDRLLLESHAISAVTSTAGAGVFKEAWAKSIPSSADLFLCFDRDEAGRMGAEKVANLLPHAKLVELPPGVGYGGDVTDFFGKLERTAEDFRALLAGGKSLQELQDQQNLLMARHVPSIHPSQEFMGDWGCFGLEVAVLNNSSGKAGPTHHLYLVTSDGKVIDATNREQLRVSHRLTLTEVPRIIGAELRWKSNHILEFQGGFNPPPREVFEKIRAVYERYVELTDHRWYTVVALWVMGTYLFRLFEAYPYLAFTGLKGSGKSKTLELTSHLAFNAVNSVGISEASLFRLVTSMRCTLALDEAELLHDRSNPKVQRIRELLNAGHRRGAYVYRQGKDRTGEFLTRRFEVYSPKLLASIRGLEDVLASRAITIVMLRANTDRGSTVITDASEEWEYLRHLLYSFALRSFGAIREAQRSASTLIANNRANDLWAPLLAIAKVVFGDDTQEFERAREFAIEQVSHAREENLDDEASTLLLALDALVRKDGVYMNRQIREKMEAFADQVEEPHISGNRVGYLMRRFGFKKERVTDGVQYRIRRSDVDDLKSRYFAHVNAEHREQHSEALNAGQPSQSI